MPPFKAGWWIEYVSVLVQVDPQAAVQPESPLHEPEQWTGHAPPGCVVPALVAPFAASQARPPCWSSRSTVYVIVVVHWLPHAGVQPESAQWPTQGSAHGAPLCDVPGRVAPFAASHVRPPYWRLRATLYVCVLVHTPLQEGEQPGSLHDPEQCTGALMQSPFAQM